MRRWATSASGSRLPTRSSKARAAAPSRRLSRARRRTPARESRKTTPGPDSTMSSSRFPERAFTLIEVMVVIVILTLLASGLALPIAAQIEARRAAETRRLLAEAREALLGFAAAHGRLPCPASDSSAGEESFAAGGDAANGNCSHFHDGFLPGATLGLAPLDTQGFVRDAWGTQRNRIRYAVFGA